MKKKGVSGIVTTALLILIALVAMALLWFGIRPILSQLGSTGSGGSGGSNLNPCFVIDIQPSQCVIANGRADVLIQRNEGEGDLSSVRFVIGTSSGEIARDYSGPDVPNEFESFVYHIQSSDVLSVNVAAILSNGRVCEPSSVPITCRTQATTPAYGLAHCFDGFDNDGDSFIDFPQDIGCANQSDTNEANENLVEDEIYIYAWNNNTAELPNVVLAYLNLWPDNGQWISFVNNHPEIIGNNAREFFERMGVPSNRRMIILASDYIAEKMGSNSSDGCDWQTTRCIWWGNGTASMAQITTRILDAYKSENSNEPLKYFVTDMEHIPGNFQIGGGNDAQTIARWNAIENDFRYNNPDVALGGQIIRDYLGFGIPPILAVRMLAWQTNTDYVTWNVMASNRVAYYLDQAFNVPVHAAIPDIKFLNYGGQEMIYDYRIPNNYGHNSIVRSSDRVISPGDYQSPSLYGSLIQITQNPIHPNGIGGAYGSTAFDAFRYETNQIRSNTLSSNKPIMPWVAFRSYMGDRTPYPGCVLNLPSQIGGSDYYQELILHILLVDPEGLLYFNNRQPDSCNNNITGGATVADDLLLSNLVVEFNNLAGFSNRQTLITGDGDQDAFELTELVPWQQDYVLTGMDSGGRRIWRFTPKLEQGESLENFVIGNNLTVYSETKEITFVDGAIYPSSADAPGGYWIVQPINSPMPSVNEIDDKIIRV